ncbi:MAG: T9SS type A sorting domain-containing protein [Bacteroidales bacterium]|nr:T9SS type A sorting domain-containing protein [Bacteroidales bacterium]MBR4469464.1 T9SS type A sorting domain-containing protein [Bacteroidales bacterium]
MSYNRIVLPFALALLWGAKAFAQEWEYSHSYIKDTVLYQYHNTYEIPLTHNIVVKEIVEPWTSISTRVGLSLLSPEGELIIRTEHYKPAFWSSQMHFLQNDDGELFTLTTYNPDHDYRSPNYFMNFDTIPDFAILGLYELDDSLNIVRSMEHRFIVDTFEMRGNEWWERSKNRRSGYIHPFSAFVDEDGNIVGNYVKAISFGHEDIAKDTIVFFRMDFDGNLITKVDYPCASTGGDVIPFCWATQSGNMVKINDSTYVMYDLSCSIFGGGGNVIYLDRDFNVTLIRRISHTNAADNYSYIYPSILRSPHNTTYVSSTVSDETKNTYDIHLYEYNDTDGLWGYMHPVHHIKRFYNWDHTASFKGIALDKAGDIYIAYTLNLGLCDCLDSWMMIERLDESMDTISTLYYDINGDVDIHSEAYDIVALSDGGILLTSNSKDMNNTRNRWNTVTKFPAEAFVGIEEAHANGLKVAIAYPNPGKDVLNIRTGLHNARVEVYDTNGKLVHRQAITEDVTPIDAAAWANGVYVWKVYKGHTKAETGKWVKE